MKRFLVLGTAIGLVVLVVTTVLACGGEKRDRDSNDERPPHAESLDRIRDQNYYTSKKNTRSAYYLLRYYDGDPSSLGVDAEELVKIQELARVWAVRELERSLNAFRYYSKDATGNYKEIKREAFDILRYSKFLGRDLRQLGLGLEERHELAHILSYKLKRDYLSCEKFKETENNLYAVLDQHPDRAHFLKTEHPSNYTGWNHVSESYLINKQALLCGSSNSNFILLASTNAGCFFSNPPKISDFADRLRTRSDLDILSGEPKG